VVQAAWTAEPGVSRSSERAIGKRALPPHYWRWRWGCCCGGVTFTVVDAESFRMTEGTTAIVAQNMRIPTKSGGDSERRRPPVPIEAGRGFR